MRLNRWQTKWAFLIFAIFLSWDAGVAVAARGNSTTCRPSMHGVHWLETPPSKLMEALLATDSGNETATKIKNICGLLLLEGQIVIAAIFSTILFYRRMRQLSYNPLDARADFVENYVSLYGKIPTRAKFQIWAAICLVGFIAMILVWYNVTMNVEICNFDGTFPKMIVNSASILLLANFIGNGVPIFLIVIGLL